MANQPTRTKSKNNYCESKCNLHVYLRDMLKKASKSFCTSNVVFPEPLSPTPSTSLAMKTPENTEDPEPADEVDFQIEYSPDLLYSPSIGAVSRNLSVTVYISIGTT
jgi:hypothetical protein